LTPCGDQHGDDDRGRDRERRGDQPRPQNGVAPLSADTGDDPRPQLRRRRLRGLATQELTELLLSPCEVGALPALGRVRVGSSRIACGKLAVDIRVQASLELLAVHALSFK
jgi:hypothetical protein